MPEPKTLLDLYGLLVADGNMSFSDAIDRLMRKEVELGATDLDKVQDQLTTQLVNSISRTEAVENREMTGMDNTSKARANLPHAKEQQQERAAAFLAATMAAYNSGKLAGRRRIASERKRRSRGSRGCDWVEGRRTTDHWCRAGGTPAVIDVPCLRSLDRIPASVVVRDSPEWPLSSAQRRLPGIRLWRLPTAGHSWPCQWIVGLTRKPSFAPNTRHANHRSSQLVD